MSLKLFDDVTEEIPVKFWTFPAGERGVRIALEKLFIFTHYFYIELLYKSSDDLVDLILLVNALRNSVPRCRITLGVPYFPFARNDRVMVDGEPHALQAIVQVILSLNLTEVWCEDAHSQVLSALFPPGLLRSIPQCDVWLPKIADNITLYSALVSPDAGAAKKIYTLAKMCGLPAFEATKVRDPKTGEITSTKFEVPSGVDINDYNRLFVVDDICDGGYTFTELAKVIRQAGYVGDLVLCVTHGIFSKGIEPLLDHYDFVLCKNNLSSVPNNLVGLE
jgi:ribose-phosphate pyrophosphokinase